jgi:hypothetical protein
MGLAAAGQQAVDGLSRNGQSASLASPIAAGKRGIQELCQPAIAHKKNHLPTACSPVVHGLVHARIESLQKIHTGVEQSAAKVSKRSEDSLVNRGAFVIQKDSFQKQMPALIPP